MKLPKSLQIAFTVLAVLAVSMFILFNSSGISERILRDSASVLESGSYSAAEELEQIKSSFNIHSIDWQLPDELPEKFTLRLIWVWETVWLEEDKLTLENIHSEQLGRRFDAEEIVKTGEGSAQQVFWIDNRNNDLPGTPLRMVVQVPDVSNDGSWRTSIVTEDNELTRAVRSGTLDVPYPDGVLSGCGVGGGILSLQFGFDENDVHCHLDFEVVEGWLGHPDED